MSQDLSAYYNRELLYLRRLAAEFAEVHGAGAERLQIGPEGETTDPHVERLLEGVAYLTARIRRKADDTYPELLANLLEVTHPHAVRAVPPLTLVALQPNAENPQITRLPRGTELLSQTVRGSACRFSIARDHTLYPLTVGEAELVNLPADLPHHPAVAPHAKSALVVRLDALSADVAIGDMGMDRLGLHLVGDDSQTLPLHRLLHSRLLAVAVDGGEEDPAPARFRPAKSVQPIGFAPEEAILPTPPQADTATVLLMEYFLLPEAFTGFTIDPGGPRSLGKLTTTLRLVFYFSESVGDLAFGVSAERVRLGCVPAINLFRPRAIAPIRTRAGLMEYRVIPPAQDTAEVWAVDEVKAGGTGGLQTLSLPPAYALGLERDAPRRFWTARRRWRGTGGMVRQHTYVSVVDMDASGSGFREQVLTVAARCTNGDLTRHLPERPDFSCPRFGGSVSRGVSLRRPTPILREPWGESLNQKLVAHLGLTYLGLTGGPLAAASLRQLLSLYCIGPEAETRRREVDALVDVEIKRTVQRVAAREGAFVSGLAVMLVFDDQRLGGTPEMALARLFLLSQVMDRVIALFAHVNTLTQVSARLDGHSQEFVRWPARLGTQALV